MRKIALITGGAKRLGRSITLHLARCGFDIVLTYNSTAPEEVKKLESEIGDSGSEFLCVKTDFTVKRDIENLFGEVRKKFGKLDLLVNNAAIFRQVDLFDITDDIFDEFIDINLKSVLFCTIESVKLMKNTGDKPCSVINIASLGGIQNWTGFIPYSVSKTGVIKLTQLLAKRLAPDVLVNCIAPGTIWIENDENITADKNEEKKYPMRRFGKESDIYNMIEFLAIKNKWMTGQTLVVDGGKSL